MTPALAAFLDSDPEVVPLIRLFHIQFDDAEYWLNETATPVSAGGRVWEPSYGWIAAEAINVSISPFEANPAYYTVWNIGGAEGQQLAYDALNNPEVWSDKIIRQLWTVRGFPDDALVLHIGKIKDVKPSESNSRKFIRIRAESIAAARNYTPLGEYTDRDQQRRFPGDRGCEYAPTMPGKKIKGWLRG